MGSKILSYITTPVMIYFEATIGTCYKSISGDTDDGIKPVKPKKQHVPEVAKRAKRERKPTFSFFRCIMRQREMCSKDAGGPVTVDSVREHYLRENQNYHGTSPFIH